MSADSEFNKYGVSTSFEKVLAHNIPGMLLTACVFMLIDISTEKKIALYLVENFNIKLFSVLLLVFIFMGFVFGLIVDELHHLLIEEKVYVPIAKAKNKFKQIKDLDGNDCTESYFLPYMGLDYYKYNLKHFYSYSEFDANIAIVLLFSAPIFPKFLDYYFVLSGCVFWAIVFATLLLFILMIYTGYTAFCDYYSAFRNKLQGILKKQGIEYHFGSNDVKPDNE